MSTVQEERSGGRQEAQRVKAMGRCCEGRGVGAFSAKFAGGPTEDLSAGAREQGTAHEKSQGKSTHKHHTRRDTGGSLPSTRLPIGKDSAIEACEGLVDDRADDGVEHLLLAGIRAEHLRRAVRGGGRGGRQQDRQGRLSAPHTQQTATDRGTLPCQKQMTS